MHNLTATKEYYSKLKTKGMSNLMSKKRNQNYLTFIKSHLEKDQKILDLACGYGRLTIPLFKQGYDIEGIDLAPNFINDAKAQAKEKKLDIKFKVGNMLKLPYSADSFDALICMWSSFNHLLTQKDQVKGLNEMLRVLKKGGYAIIDMPYHPIKNGKHLVTAQIGGLELTDFIHDKTSLSEVIKKSKIKQATINIEPIGDRKRLLLYLYK